MIYLDNSATTRPFDRVVQKMAQSMGEGFFNPSSLYAQALLASDEIKRAKGLISAALGGVDRVVLTGGGTEADNLAILGLADGLRGRKAGFITTSVEHRRCWNAFAACRSRAMRPIWPPWMHPAWCAWTNWWTMWGRTQPWYR